MQKVPLGLVPSSFMAHVAAALRDGAGKYGRFNWRDTKVIGSIYVDAILRHIFAYIDGEDHAPDSGVHHLGHAAAGLAIILDAMENGQMEDDRPIEGRAAEIFEGLKTTGLEGA